MKRYGGVIVFVLASILAAQSGAAMPQDVQPTPVPPIKPADIAEDKRPSTKNSRLRLLPLGTIHAVAAEYVTVQGQSRPVTYVDLRFYVDVTNEGNVGGNYKLVTVVPGAPRNHVSELLRVEEGDKRRTVLRLRS